MMKPGKLIAIDIFCTNHNIEVSVISTLQEFGLIEIITIKESQFIDANELHQLEKFVRLYYDLGINMEGIETINHLLTRINSMQDEINTLKNQLRLFELE